MYFYEIVPGDRSYHGKKTLTYCSEAKLRLGQIVVVMLRTKSITGFVSEAVDKPSFATKPIDTIIDEAVLSSEQVALSTWLRNYYPAPLGVIGGLFMPPAITVKNLGQTSTESVRALKNDLPELTKDQENAKNFIEQGPQKTVILHGDTGTGKTRLYIELARETIRQGKSVLVLTPEIGLTPQLVGAFEENFSHTCLTHSELTDTKRRELWRKLAASTEPQLLIGPRSALFMPLQNIGLIIMDEFHDGAYKQEQAPYYRSIRVASTLRGLHNATLVLGSATPPIEDYYYAQQKDVPVLRMTEKPRNSRGAETKIIVVDLADKNEQTKQQLITKTLVKQIKGCLDAKQQVLLFLNKRGSARLLVCQSCGWFASCDRCDLPYTYHQDGHRLQCHTCGNKREAPNACPECGSAEIIFKSPGTKTIELGLKALFPDARVARFDRDNNTSETFSARHGEVHDGSIDILIGTQLLAKGHDLPNLALVGILMADNGLQFPDYSSEERSYQLLHQLAGRVGRGHQTSIVVVQTYNPGSELLRAVDHTNNNWSSFYESQLKERKDYGFPPFFHVLKIEVSRTQSVAAEKAIESVVGNIKRDHKQIAIIGPSPSFIAKKGNKYYWQAIIKTARRDLLLGIIESLPPKTSYDIDPLTLL